VPEAAPPAPGSYFIEFIDGDGTTKETSIGGFDPSTTDLKLGPQALWLHDLMTGLVSEEEDVKGPAGRMHYSTDGGRLGAVQGYFLVNGISRETRFAALALASPNDRLDARNRVLDAETWLRIRVREQDVALKSLLALRQRLGLPVEEDDDAGGEYLEA